VPSEGGLALEPAGEDGHIVETSTPNTLRFPFFLRDLSLAEQITSAETLLERVLANLSLGEDLLTDAPRITRRGYSYAQRRLVVRANLKGGMSRAHRAEA
jgi:hypothetical protein